MNFAQCLHVALVIGKHTNVFRGDFFEWGDGVKWEDISMEKILSGKKLFQEGAPDFQY